MPSAQCRQLRLFLRSVRAVRLDSEGSNVHNGEGERGGALNHWCRVADIANRTSHDRQNNAGCEGVVGNEGFRQRSKEK
jgi:hypothetical protein